MIRGGKISPVRWASPVRPKLGPGWAIKLLAQKKSGQIWPEKNRAKFGPASPIFFFFVLKRLFGPTGSVFRAGWAIKILVRKNRANFGTARFLPGPLLAQLNQARPARLPPLLVTSPCLVVCRAGNQTGRVKIGPGQNWPDFFGPKF